MLEYSASLAGRLAGLLLADQGATVSMARDAPLDAPLDAFLDRGKWRDPARGFAPGAVDVVIRDGLGADPRPAAQIRLAITAVLPGEAAYPFADEVGDDVLKAVTGFYTDLASTRRLLGDEVIYTPLPLCSVYAGVLGALAIAAALGDHARHGDGRDIVISRLAAGLSAIGALTLEVDGLPAHLAPSALLRMPTELTPLLEEARADAQRFEWLKRHMNPFVACYPAADGRLVMMFAVANRAIARRLLQTLGIWQEMVAAGLVDVSPYDPANAAYADFLEAYGKGGRRAMERGQLHNLARLYWYTVEFGLIQTAEGLRIFGAGILSSPAETLFSLEDSSPNRIAFDLERVMRTKYIIDDFQQIYFVIDSFEKLLEDCYQDFGPVYDRLRTVHDIEAHELAETDRIITRGDLRYFRAKGKALNAAR